MLRPMLRSAHAFPLLAMTCLLGCSSAPKAEKAAPAAKPEPVYFEVQPGTAGAMAGKVLFTGKRQPPKRIDMDEDPQCAAAHHGPAFDESLVVSKSGALANVFVYIRQGLEGKQFRPSAEAVTVDQRGCWFHPRVVGIQTGQPLTVKNSDPVTHNIHPKARMNREWNQSQSPGVEPFTKRFARPEIMIRVKCDIHAWMRAWIGVVDNPYFAVTGADGRFEIGNVPAGEYTLEAWQEVLGKQEQKVTVTAAGKTDVAFTFKGE
jgi:plastocyanin